MENQTFWEVFWNIWHYSQWEMAQIPTTKLSGVGFLWFLIILIMIVIFIIFIFILKYIILKIKNKTWIKRKKIKKLRKKLMKLKEKNNEKRRSKITR